MHKSKKRYPRKVLPRFLLLALFGGLQIISTQYVFAANLPKQTVTAQSATAQAPVIPADVLNNQIKSLTVAGQLRAALELMQGQESQYENDAEFFYNMGRLASQLEQHQLAANIYERAVLIRPEYVGAWLELAIANFALGNREVAVSYFAYIQENFYPPKEVLQAIEKELQKYAVEKTKSKAWSYSLDLASGVDTNANSGLRVDTLSLTDGELREFFTLDDKFKARTDRFNQLGVGVQYANHTPEQRISFFSSLKQKSFVQETDFSTLDAQASLAYQKNSAWGELSYWLQLQHISLGNVPTLFNSKVQAQLERPWGACAYSAGVELERRSFLQSPNMDGRLIWAQGGLSCSMTLSTVPLYINVTSRVGQDFATRERAGGNSQNNETVVQVSAALSKNFKASFSQAYSTSRDTEGYSPKLENNAKRTIGRYISRLQLNWSLSPSFDILMNFENYHVNTNIALFKQGGKAFSLNIRQAF
nr:tetratricopeptide repeat protein [uncultured Undibacterium sp.]